MAQIEKLEVQAEIKSSADKFYQILRSKGHLLPTICPNLVKDVKLIKGDWETLGSVRQWTYVTGNSENSKEEVEAIDEENKSITFAAVDGDITQYYKNVKATLQVTEKAQGGSSVKWTLEYEKKNENFPAPNQYLDFVSIVTKQIDAYLTNNT
ncbi:hypothetical protein UlMin_040849 [Ulmus minor]